MSGPPDDCDQLISPMEPFPESEGQDIDCCYLVDNFSAGKPLLYSLWNGGTTVRQGYSGTKRPFHFTNNYTREDWIQNLERDMQFYGWDPGNQYSYVKVCDLANFGQTGHILRLKYNQTFEPENYMVFFVNAGLGEWGNLGYHNCEIDAMSTGWMYIFVPEGPEGHVDISLSESDFIYPIDPPEGETYPWCLLDSPPCCPRPTFSVTYSGTPQQGTLTLNSSVGTASTTGTVDALGNLVAQSGDSTGCSMPCPGFFPYAGVSAGVTVGFGSSLQSEPGNARPYGG